MVPISPEPGVSATCCPGWLLLLSRTTSPEKAFVYSFSSQIQTCCKETRCSMGGDDVRKTEKVLKMHAWVSTPLFLILSLNFVNFLNSLLSCQLIDLITHKDTAPNDIDTN